MTRTLHLPPEQYKELETMRQKLGMSWLDYIIYAKKKWDERHGAITPDSFTTDKEKVD